MAGTMLYSMNKREFWPQEVYKIDDLRNCSVVFNFSGVMDHGLVGIRFSWKWQKIPKNYDLNKVVVYFYLLKTWAICNQTIILMIAKAEGL